MPKKKTLLKAVNALSATSGGLQPINATGDLNVTRQVGESIYLYFDVPSAIAEITSATLKLNAYDVDFPVATEHDKVYFNGKYIGQLQGYNNGWEFNSFPVPVSWIKRGSNTVRIHVDVDRLGWVTRVSDVQLILNGQEGAITLSQPTESQNAVLLNWSANFTGTTFNLYRGTSENQVDELLVEKTSAFSYRDDTVVPGQIYYYQVMSISGVSSKIEKGGIRIQLIKVIPSQDLYHKVQLSWSTENCTGPFTIYRGDTQENLLDARLRWMVGKDIAGNIFEENVDGGRDWFYQVVASDGTASDPVKISVKLAEIKLKVTIDQDDGVKLTWACHVDGLGYYVCRSASPVNEWEDYTGQYEMLTKDWLGHNKLIYRNNYFDDRASEGCEYAYYVVSSLGVASNIEYGRRENTYRAPSFSMTKLLIIFLKVFV